LKLIMPSTRRDVLAYSLGLGSTAVFAQGKAQSLPAVGQSIALPEAALLGGGAFKPAQAQGKITVVYWWASWCPFCAIQSPHIEALWKAHQARGLQVLALSIDKTEQAAKDYLAKKNYSFPAAMFTPAMGQVLAKPKGLPVVIVRGKDGKVLHAESGEMFPEDIEKIGQWI
jgi:thiol-disulfide isomerase/thioredoxin